MPGIQLNQQQNLNISPRLFAANHIMQLSIVEIEQAIIQEINNNPALEIIEQLDCSICGRPLQWGVCQQCSAAGSSLFSSSFYSGEMDADDRANFLEAIPASLSLHEYIYSQLRLILDSRDYRIALYLVGNLNEHGYLELSVDEAAQALQIGARHISFVLDELQQLEPAGIGARDLRECLLLQVEWLLKQSIDVPPGTQEIIAHYLKELGNHQFERISHELKMKRADIAEAFSFIRTNLHPYPANHYYDSSSTSNSVFTEHPFIVPSILIHNSTSGDKSYEVEIVESRRFSLYVNPLYQQMRQDAGLLALSPKEYAHITHYLERARLFISQIHRRNTLLLKVASYLVKYQRAYLDEGPLSLAHLTQETVAQELGVHVSTISRAISNKFVQLPSQHIVPLSCFFSGDQRIQEQIRQIIMRETEPLSDAHVSQILHSEYGITLSRQMVANYRQKLGIAAARQRTFLHRS